MSYCRFTDGDVYAYACEGGVQFYVSGGANDKTLDRICNTYNEAYQYAKILRDEYGLDVPSYAIEAMRDDAIQEAERTCGPASAVSELRAENAKLRELVYDMLVDEERGHNDDSTFDEHVERANELGVKFYA